MSSQNFVLSDFASLVEMNYSATIDDSFTPASALDVSAVAVLTVDVNKMKAAFKYQSDAVDVINNTVTDVRYIVDISDLSGASGLTNAANAMFVHDLAPLTNANVPSASTGGALYAPDKMMVAHDFVRHLAKQLFGTHFGVDLFSNESELLSNIRTRCDNSSTGVMGVIMNKLKDISLASAVTTDAKLYTQLDGNGNLAYKYKTDDDDSEHNIGRIFFRQLLNADPERIFSAFNAADTSNPQSIPFIDGDSFSFKLTIKPAPGQGSIVSPIKADTDIKEKSYEIKIYLKDTASVSNLPVAADE